MLLAHVPHSRTQLRRIKTMPEHVSCQVALLPDLQLHQHDSKVHVGRPQAPAGHAAALQLAGWLAALQVPAGCCPGVAAACLLRPRLCQAVAVGAVDVEAVG